MFSGPILGVVEQSPSPSPARIPPKRRLACALSWIGASLPFNAPSNRYRTSLVAASSPTTNNTTTKHQTSTPRLQTKTFFTPQQTSSTMAGGKGKSSGGKSSGGKSGHDSGKKQQSHSSKAGLQVSIILHCAKLCIASAEASQSVWRHFEVWVDGGSVDIFTPQCRVIHINNNKTDGKEDFGWEHNALHLLPALRRSGSAIKTPLILRYPTRLAYQQIQDTKYSTPASHITRPRIPPNSHTSIYMRADYQKC